MQGRAGGAQSGQARHGSETALRRCAATRPIARRSRPRSTRSRQWACRTSWSTTRATARAARSSSSIPREVEKTLAVTAYAGFLVAQAAAKRMLPRGSGAIFFTGASASVKGYANSAPFAMGKFALRGLAQSMARELAPKGIHVAHFVIDGGIGKDAGDAKLDPDEIANTYLQRLPPAPQRMDLGSRAAAVGGALLKLRLYRIADAGGVRRGLAVPASGGARAPRREARAGAVHAGAGRIRERSGEGARQPRARASTTRRRCTCRSRSPRTRGEWRASSAPIAASPSAAARPPASARRSRSLRRCRSSRCRPPMPAPR